MKQKAEPIVSEFEPYVKKNRILHKPTFNLVVLGGIGVVAIIAAIMGILSLERSNGPVCSTALIQDAAKYIHKDQPSDLSKVASQVGGLNGYKNDANCMYIMSAYYYQDGNAPEAKGSYNQLIKDTENHKTVSSVLLKYYSITSLGQYISLAYTDYKNNLQNSINLSPRQPVINQTKK